MKRLNKTHIFHIFFGLLMFLPFISILSRVIYVQSNKNAKDSYSGNYEITYKYESNQVQSEDDLITNNIYSILLDDNTAGIFPNNEDRLVFLPITLFELNKVYYSGEDFLQCFTFKDIVIEIYNDNGNVYFYVYTSLESFENNEDYCVSYILNNIDIISDNKFIGKLIDCNNITSSIFSYTDYNEIESVNLSGTLDNAFDYSISKFIEDNNFKINFFSWFEDLFLIQNGGVNALYLSFANWYMCYALLVSTGYLLFLILMWFINYVRKILEGGNSFGHGGF